MIRNNRGCYHEGRVSYGGCSCHNTKRDLRPGKKGAKAREKKQWLTDAATNGELTAPHTYEP